jgi:hypothetical protein
MIFNSHLLLSSILRLSDSNTLLFLTHISYSHQSYAYLIVIHSLHPTMTFPNQPGNFILSGSFFRMITRLIASFVGVGVIGHG